MEPAHYLAVARAPLSLKSQTFGLWTIRKRRIKPEKRAEIGGAYHTALCRMSMAGLHLPDGEVVMEDSMRELRKHLPIWLAARGRVLVTGLGLGCVVRGLIANPAVEHVDVVEIDDGIMRVIGPGFAGHPRVALHHGDALTIELTGSWDFAWHDLWTDGDVHLQRLHAQLFARFDSRCGRQGAWDFPRFTARMMPWRPLGAPNRQRLQRRAR